MPISKAAQYGYAFYTVFELFLFGGLFVGWPAFLLLLQDEENQYIELCDAGEDRCFEYVKYREDAEGRERGR